MTFLHLLDKVDFDIPKWDLCLYTLMLKNCQFILKNYYEPHQDYKNYDIIIHIHIITLKQNTRK